MMAQGRIVLSRLIGGVQCVIGTLVFITAYALLASPWVREILSVAEEESFLLVFLLFIFGIFSILSGLILIREKR
jgi:hypothetical protein